MDEKSSGYLVDSLGGEEGRLTRFDAAATHVVGVLAGEGIGPEIVPAALSLIDPLARFSGRKVEIREAGPVGRLALSAHGKCLPDHVVDFVRGIFAEKGALFCGPGGERFVYELRREFDLFCKFTPLQPFPELLAIGPLRPEVAGGADIVAVREGLGGLYQGNWDSGRGMDGEAVATHSLRYTEGMVRRVLRVAVSLSRSRRRVLHVVLKPGGAPTISELWRDCAQEMAAAAGVRLHEHEIDNAAYQIAANPSQYDVIVSPNMFGDVLADCGALLLASRGLSFSGNFDSGGNGVFQTGHGAARDIAGTDSANPIGQMLSLGMMLRESFSWPSADLAIRNAVRSVLRGGLCTADIPLPGGRIVGTREFADAVRKSLSASLASGN